MNEQMPKFRAWYANSSQMWQWGEFRFKVNQGCYQFISPSGLPVRNHAVKLMQFTGLHDVDGIEIYEGDIVRVAVETIMRDFGYHDREVEFEGGCYVVNLNDIGAPGSWAPPLGEFAQQRMKVVGNIYQGKN